MQKEDDEGNGEAVVEYDAEDAEVVVEDAEVVVVGNDSTVYCWAD